jgi:hypothetical protein
MVAPFGSLEDIVMRPSSCRTGDPATGDFGDVIQNATFRIT